MSQSRESRSRVSELVHSAEKQILSGRHDVALEQLRRAQELDPQNQYIHAIIQRAELAGQNAGVQRPQNPLSELSHQSSRYLSVTVGEERSGLGSAVGQGAVSGEEITRRIRELTETAHVLLNRGLKESAFDSLMRAYLLDPLHPDVISCEQKVLPAWENLRRLKDTASSDTVTPSTPAERLRSLRRESLATTGAKERNLWQALSGPPPRPGQADSPEHGRQVELSGAARTRKKKP